MLRDIPNKIKIKGHIILITPSGSYSCDAFCKTNDSFCISEYFSDEERSLNDQAYLKSYKDGVTSYRNIMWNCWERLEKKITSSSLMKSKKYALATS